MGKKDKDKEKEKDKSKKYNEIRAIVREELEKMLRNLSVHVQLNVNPQTEEAQDAAFAEESKDQQPTEVLAEVKHEDKAEAPPQESS